VKEGEIFRLTRPEWRGKSTLIRMMTTLIFRSRQEWRALPDTMSQGSECRAQNHRGDSAGATSDLDLTVEENLNIYASSTTCREERKRSIEELLGLVILTKVAQCTNEDASGGMRRRLGDCARSGASSKIFFLDEPTTGLDPVSRVAVWKCSATS